ncbi:MAG: sugar ABC transporter permease [Acidimicrobiales bacterium]
MGSGTAFNVSNWTNIFTSQLFFVAVALVAAGFIVGMVSGKKRHGINTFERTGSSLASISVGIFLFLFAAFSVLRGTFFNNLWWVLTVTTMSTVLGLTIAVLAERSGRLESLAKSLIFMPMAVSFVGASIVWRLQYQPRDVSRSQTGLLNAGWVELGRLSHSGWPRVLVLLALAGIFALLVRKAMPRVQAGETFGAYVAAGIVVAYLFVELLRRSLGGFRFNTNGDLVPDTVLFIQNQPFNNVFLMIILIWIQTGFAMVILSAAIKAVPEEFIEAAKVDGATESQIFFRIVLPQILPTIGVIVTTLIVLVTKVFDIVKVTTNGNFGTNVLANDMYTESFSFFNQGLGAAIAVFILISVLPVMIMNIRRMQQERSLR